MEFLYIKGSSEKDVRLSKCITTLTRLGHGVKFWGWSRSSKQKPNPLLCECRYLYRLGTYGRGSAIHYPFWMISLFFAALFARKLKGVEIVAVNFDAAFPLFCASLFRGFKFTYEIYDEFSISYRFPPWLKTLLLKLDHLIIKQSKLAIHVDENRVRFAPEKSIVIENSPDDYWDGVAVRDYTMVQRIFAVTGCLSDVRGITSIEAFAKSNPTIKILVVGDFHNGAKGRSILSLPNVEHYSFMPQRELFKLLEKCCAIFSLYDPNIEINRLAASNKVYDAMMMGIPVITNRDVINSKFIHENRIGVVVDYQYGETWKKLEDLEFVDCAVSMGKKGRALYLSRYQFSKMFNERFVSRIVSGR